MIVVWIIIAVAVVAIAVILVSRRRRRADGVDSFRRQIDALSPEARRPVVDQVQSVAETGNVDQGDEPADTVGDEPPGDSSSDDRSDDA